MSINLLHHISLLKPWFEKWKIKINNTKSTHVTFTLSKKNDQSNHVKYLGIHLDKRLTWKNNIKTKRQKLKILSKNFNWMIGKSELSIHNNSCYTNLRQNLSGIHLFNKIRSRGKKHKGRNKKVCVGVHQ